MSKQQLLIQLKTLVDQQTDDTAKNTIKQEVLDLFPAEATTATADDTNQRVLTETLSKLSLTQTMKQPKYQKGDNFARYCQRFEEYVSIFKIKDNNLYMYFLQNVNDETYSILKTVELSPADKADAKLFCPLYKTAIYGDVSISLKNEVMECKQRSDEKISDYVYRLREKAAIAYTDAAMFDENCFIAFLKGVKDPHLRRKLNEETSLTNFQAAVKLAKRLEKVEKLFDSRETEVNSILKESTYTNNTTYSNSARDHSQNHRFPSNFPNYREGSSVHHNKGYRSRNN